MKYNDVLEDLNYKHFAIVYIYTIVMFYPLYSVMLFRLRQLYRRRRYCLIDPAVSRVAIRVCIMANK